MKAKWAMGLASVAVAMLVSQSWAFCENHAKAAKVAKAAQAATQSVETAKTPCGGQTAGQAETAATETKKPCCAEKAALAAAQAEEGAKATPCGGQSAAQAATAAAETKKPCCAEKAALAASAEGGKPCCGKPSGCSSSKTWLTVDGPSRAVLANLPSMRYRVGDDTLDCPMEAEKMALKLDKPIQYVVGEKVYNAKPEATVALAASLEEAAKDLQAVHLVVAGKTVDCPHAASQLAKESNSPVAFRVAGIDFPNREKAEAAAKLASEAAGSVKMSFKVGDDSFCCDRMAGMKAKETGKKITYVVAGEETCCEQTARLLLAQAKVRALLEAAANGKA